MGVLKKLSPKQELFVREYLVDLNGSAAARRAGYSAKADYAIANKLLKVPAVKAAIAAEMKTRVQELKISKDEVLREIHRIAMLDIGRAFDEHDNLKPMREIPEDLRRAIAGVEIFEEFAGKGEAREYIGRTKKIKLADKLGALRILAAHVGLVTEKHEVKHTWEDVVAKSWEGDDAARR